MRSLLAALAIVTVLSLGLAEPAAAAPVQNPQVFTYTVTCGSDSWDAISKGTAGWPLGPGDITPDLFFGGRWTLTVGDEVTSWTDPIPAGLASQLQTCRIEGPLEPADFHLVIDPAYLMFLPH